MDDILGGSDLVASTASFDFRWWLRLSKKSFEGTRHEISCPLGGIAHHRHEGTGRDTQNPVLTARRALETASGVVLPLQNKSGEFSRHLIADFFNSLSHKRSFEQSAATVEFCPCRQYYQAGGKMKQTIQWRHAWRRLGVAAILFCVLDAPADAGLQGVTPLSAPAVLTLHEPARFLRIGSGELERLVRRNEVSASRIGTHWRFDRMALLAAEAATAHAFEVEDLEKLKETGRCIKCDLFGAKLSGANLPGVNLSGADLYRPT